jgi:RimJ/RimL family protein N-acetyltransferase
MKSIVFNTRRLIVRIPNIDREDHQFLFELWNNPKVMCFVGFPKGLNTSLEKVKKQLFDENKKNSSLDRVLMIEDHNKKVIGQCKLGSTNDKGVAITDVKLHPDSWGNKYGQEIKYGLLDYLFTKTAAKIVEATPNVKNRASIVMQQSVGGKEVGVYIHKFSEEKKHNTCTVESIIFHVFKDEWLKRREIEDQKITIRVNDEIVLTEIRDCDVDAYIDHFNNNNIHDNFVGNLLPYTKEKFYQFQYSIRKETLLQKNVINFAIRGNDDRLIGQINFTNISLGKSHSAEIAYWLAELFWNKGIMTKVVTALTNHAFNHMGLQRVQAHTLDFNTGSQKVLKKAGYKYEGTIIAKFKRETELLDAKLFSMVNLG